MRQDFNTFCSKHEGYIHLTPGKLEECRAWACNFWNHRSVHTTINLSPKLMLTALLQSSLTFGRSFAEVTVWGSVYSYGKFT